MKLLGRRVRFGDRARADVVIYDVTGSQYVRRALNPALSVAAFEARPPELRVSARILWSFFRNLAEIQLKSVDRSHGTLRGVVRELWLIYVKSDLLAMRPKAVVTFIDNSPNFHWLSRHCRTVPFIAIQNGSRLRFVTTGDDRYYLQHLFSWGRHEQDLFPQLNYVVETYHPVGSLVASLHFVPADQVPAKAIDLLVVSTWRGNIGFSQDVRDTMRSMRIMDELLAEYIRSRGIKAAVILRAARDSDHWMMPEIGATEEEYYQKMYGNSIEIIDTDFSTRNIFPLMQRSRVVLSCLSSALHEAFGIGKKVLYCNFTGTDIYHADLDEAIVASDSDRDAFYVRLDALLSLPTGEYHQKYRLLQYYYMSNPDTEPTHRSIARGIDEIISAHAAGLNG